jgi:hypothetical protein
VSRTRSSHGKESRRVQQLRVQGREWSVSLVNFEDWVQIRTEEYRAIEDEITRRLYSD